LYCVLTQSGETPAEPHGGVVPSLRDGFKKNTNMVTHRHQKFVINSIGKKISGILIFLVLGLILTAGCFAEQTPIWPGTPFFIAGTAPTTNTHFHMHEPATDGSLSVIVLNITAVRGRTIKVLCSGQTGEFTFG
jgi:hypothetical protein